MAARQETVLTLTVTPGRRGTRIDRRKYEAVRKAILAVVPRSKEGIPFKSLPRAIAPRLPRELFPARGSVSWYATVVKLDLEAHRLIERIPGKSPQHLRRVRKSAAVRAALKV